MRNRSIVIYSILVVLVFGSGALAAVDGFESCDLAASGWCAKNSNASITERAANSGRYGAKLAKTTWIEKAVSTKGLCNIHVKYYRHTVNIDRGKTKGYGFANLYVEWFDGCRWANLETVRRADYRDCQQDRVCGAGANDNEMFKIRFRVDAKFQTKYAYIDDVEITGTAK